MATAGIEVYVKLPTGKVLSLQHWPGHTVGDIAKKVADSENVPEPRVRLKYQGKTLDKKKTISYLGICMETILKAEILVPRDTNITLELPSGEKVDLVMQSTDTVTRLRQAVLDRSRIQTTQQILKVNKVVINGDTSILADVGIFEGVVITVEKKAQNSVDHNNEFTDEVNEEIKQDLLNTFDCGGRNVEVVFSFDTTGSMYSCIERVRSKLRETCSRLFRDIPNIRIGIMANGDYCDNYVVRYQDLTTDVETILDFTNNVPRTGGGGNGGEAYEWALRKAQELDWSEDSAKAFVLIGDEPPHVSGFTDQDLSWKDEVDVLAGMGIKVYGVQALSDRLATPFYKEIADRSEGFYLKLQDFSLITDMFLAVCYREADDGQFEQFVEEVEKDGRLTENTKLFLDKLDEKQTPKPEVSRTDEISTDNHSSEAWWTRNSTRRPNFEYNQTTDTWKDISQLTSGIVAMTGVYYPTRQAKKSKWRRFLRIFRIPSGRT